MSKNKIKLKKLNYRVKNYWLSELNKNEKFSFVGFKILFGDLFVNGRKGRKK